MRTDLRHVTAALCASLLLGALPLQGQEETVDRSATLSLASGAIDVHQPPAIPAELRAATAQAGSEDVLLVKFPRPATADQIDALASRVERVYAYLPYDAFLVKAEAAHRDRLLDAAVGSSWVGPYHPAYKISPAVAVASAGAGGLRIVLLHVFPDADVDAVAQEVALLGRGQVVAAKQRDRFSRIRLLMTPADVAAARTDLARLAGVSFIDLEGRRVLANDTTVWVAQSGTAGGTQTPIHDQGIHGSGQVIGIIDTGIDPDMCYFADGVLGLPPINPCDGGTLVDNAQRKVIAVDFLWSSDCAGGISFNEWDNQDHGTHVAGSAAADDFANPIDHDPGDGLAPGAKLVIQDGGFLAGDDCADLPGLGCPVVDLVPIFQQAYDQGARIHTNSWGDEENNPVHGLYSAGSEDADELMWENPDFLLLFAAGNDGPGPTTVLSPSTAKSVIAVGATQRGGSAESMSGFSSCGPTADGRIKPDITMPGSSIISANSDNNTTTGNCNTRSSSGTSMASPAAAGAAALVRQYYTDGWYPTGAANPPDAFTPSGALLKATLINSGHDMAGAAAIPGVCQGWGRVLLDDVLAFTGQSRDLFVVDDAVGVARGAGGGDRVFTLSIEAGEPLEVTLAWSDFPSTPAAGTHLINDLDLTVTGPGGTFLGNAFSGGESTSGGSADRLNSIEQVLIKTPPPGAYTVTVSGFNVPTGPQPFALVVTGACASGGCSGEIFSDGFESGDTTAWSGI